MKSKLLLIAFILISSFCYSQDIEIRGTVKESATGLPIPGATVMVKNSTIGTVTDIDGNFTLAAPSGSVLQISFIGFVTVEREATAEVMAINMEEDTQTLEEVVVIGYGTQRRREVTGAVSVVTADAINDLRPVRIEQALQGTVSGVNVTNQSGAPGAGLNITIRGIASNRDNRPLVLVDGYISEAGFSDLNFNDIENITVLKDSQAAIYGTAGANGVILVTTKRGRKNSQLSFSYNTYMGLQETTRKLPLLNATEYALLLNEAYANNGQPLPFPNPTQFGVGTDWQEEVFDDNVPMIQHDFSASGGSENMTYTFSGSSFTQDGIVGGAKSHFDRYTFRLGLTADVLKNVRVNSNVIYADANRQSFNENTLGSVLFNAINTPAIYTPYDAAGNFTVLPTGSADVPGSNLGNEIINPLAQIANTFNDYDMKRISGTFGVDWDVYSDLTITGRIGWNSQNSFSKSFSPQISYGGKVFDNPRSFVSENSIADNDYTFDGYATYKKSIAEAHNITAMLGTTVYKAFGQAVFGTGFDIPNNSWDFASLNLAQGLPTSPNVNSYKYDQRRLSYFARIQYDYKGRYLISGMYRRDTSTKFGPDKRVAYFPSITGGWVISEEPFYGESQTLNFLKLRASYGIMGNDRIGDFRYRSLLTGEATYVFDGELVNGVAIGPLSNPVIAWEEARKFDVGLDAKLFNDKVEFIADYFIDKRAGLLIENLPVSGIGGAGGPGGQNPTINAGDVINRGFEFSIGYNDKIGEDFSFGLNYNVTFIHNEVSKIHGAEFIQGGAFGVGQPAPTRMQEGQPIGYFYGYQTAGIFQTQAEVDAHPSQAALGAEAQPGDLRFVDVNGDGVINANDRTNIGDPIPDATMGFNIQLNYKGIDFVAYSYASLGNDMVRNYERTLTDINRHAYVLDRWTGPGTSNEVPRVTTAATANNVFSDYFVEDASFLRIQNVQLGYTINPDLTKRAAIQKLRFYVGVNNLYTFTKYKGYDPSAVNYGSPDNPNALNAGIDYGFYPVPRTYMFGMNVNF